MVKISLLDNVTLKEGRVNTDWQAKHIFFLLTDKFCDYEVNPLIFSSYPV